MDSLRSNPLIAGGVAAGCTAAVGLACCMRSGGGKAAVTASKTRGATLTDSTPDSNGSVRTITLLEPTSFRLDIPDGWQHDEEDQHGARVFKFKKECADPQDDEAPEEQPVLLILEKLTEDVTVEKYAETAKEGTVAQLERLGDVVEVNIADKSLFAGSGRSQKQFVQWQLRLRSDPQEDAEHYNDHGEPEQQDPINMWSGVCIHSGYAWAFQICGGSGFEEMLDQARKIARSLQFTDK